MTTVTCSYGSVAVQLEGPPILACECHCASCHSSANRLQAAVTEENGGTRFVLQIKDKVAVLRGKEHLASFRLTADASTQHVIATCCNAPIWMEFKGGHWIGVYGFRWPEGTAQKPEMRTMTKESPIPLPDDLPHARTQSAGFMGSLFWAWVQMGFRDPPIAKVTRTHDV